ncbi:MAG TPA: hypothetical protein VGH86_08615 [Phenylobacterium sp.]|jgi:hypothetical protein
MGSRNEDRRPLAWQGSLAQMKTYGTRVARACVATDCRRWVALNVDSLIAEYGPDHMLWDRRPPCALCGGKTHYMASPGPSTPFRPLLGGAVADQVRRDFLRGFGFTRRDVRRIKAMAEATNDLSEPKALDDLDVPYRVGCCRIGRESYSSGRVLGEWAGRTLLYWEMNQREAEVWRRKRRRGPKAMPR